MSGIRTDSRTAGSLVTRRRFLASATAVGWAGAAWGRSFAAEPPRVSEPRATSGDTAVEPAWDERLTISVGPHAADLVGTTEKALQGAVDYMARRGGGTVRILPGTYRLRNAVYLASQVRLLGSGPETVLVKEPSVRSELAADSDWFDQEITLADPRGFEVGDGICLETTNPHDGGHDVAKRTLVARSGNRFKLDRALRQNFWQLGNSTCATLFPLLSGTDGVTDVVVEDLVLDGNRQANDNLNGNYAGCIFLEDAARVTIRGVTARNYNGDGLSWQIAHDVLVERCHSHGHAGLALHPGSGSQRPVMRENLLEDADQGIFFCWGVKYGLAERNTVRRCRLGISLGHRDTHNLVVNNQIELSGECGIVFRPERGRPFAAHHNQVVENRILDTGGDEAVAIDVQGQTEGLRIAGNALRETRAPARRIGLRLGAELGAIELGENQIEGFATPIADLRPTGPRS